MNTHTIEVMIDISIRVVIGLRPLEGIVISPDLMLFIHRPGVNIHNTYLFS